MDSKKVKNYALIGLAAIVAYKLLTVKNINFLKGSGGCGCEDEAPVLSSFAPQYPPQIQYSR